MTLTEMVAVIGGTVTAMLALYGLDAWRREHAGKRRMELAEDALALFYEAEVAIAHVRSPASFGHERQDLVRDDQETDAQYAARQQASIVFVRFATYSELFNKIYAMRYRFMAQIGKAEAQPFADLRGIVNEVQSSARVLATLWSQNNFQTEAAFESHRRLVERYEATFGWGDPEDDPIPARVAAVIAAIETTCQGVISGRGTLFSVFNLRVSWKK